MWQRLEPHIADFDITRIAHLTHLDNVGVPVHMAMRPTGRVLSSGSGKGTTELGSMISACMEAIEQTFWEDARPELRIETEANLIRFGDRFVSPAVLPQRRHGVHNPALPSAWVMLRDLATHDDVWVPAETTALGGRGIPRLNRVMSSSNGLASGASVDDALLSGLYELIERDAIACASTHALPALPCSGAAIDELLAHVERANVPVWLDDLTSDVGLPTVRAVVGGPVGIASSFVGYGTSADVEHASVRAVTEALQSRCIVIAGARDDIFELERRAAARLWTKPESRPTPTHEISEVRSTGSTAGDLNQAIDHLRTAGLDQVLVYRHTTDADPVEVVRVVVPGLEGYPGPHTQPGARAAEASSRAEVAP